MFPSWVKRSFEVAQIVTMSGLLVALFVLPGTTQVRPANRN